MFQNESNKLNHIMQNNLIDKQLVDTTMAQCGVSNLDDASIRDTVKIANLLEKATGEKFIRMKWVFRSGSFPYRNRSRNRSIKTRSTQFYHDAGRLSGTF